MIVLALSLFIAQLPGRPIAPVDGRPLFAGHLVERGVPLLVLASGDTLTLETAGAVRTAGGHPLQAAGACGLDGRWRVVVPVQLDVGSWALVEFNEATTRRLALTAQPVSSPVPDDACLMTVATADGAVVRWPLEGGATRTQVGPPLADAMEAGALFVGEVGGRLVRGGPDGQLWRDDGTAWQLDAPLVGPTVRWGDAVLAVSRRGLLVRVGAAGAVLVHRFAAGVRGGVTVWSQALVVVDDQGGVWTLREPSEAPRLIAELGSAPVAAPLVFDVLDEGSPQLAVPLDDATAALVSVDGRVTRVPLALRATSGLFASALDADARPALLAASGARQAGWSFEPTSRPLFIDGVAGGLAFQRNQARVARVSWPAPGADDAAPSMAQGWSCGATTQPMWVLSLVVLGVWQRRRASITRSR